MSWHFTVGNDGEVLQHYALNLITWHAGQEANLLYVGIECEGTAGHAIRGPQLEALAELVRWIARVDHWESYTRGITLFEHNEFMNTACPSGRIPWQELIRHVSAAP